MRTYISLLNISLLLSYRNQIIWYLDSIKKTIKNATSTRDYVNDFSPLIKLTGNYANPYDAYTIQNKLPQQVKIEMQKRIDDSPRCSTSNNYLIHSTSLPC